MNNYEISRKTLALIPISKVRTKIVEEDREFIINKECIKIIDNSCKFFGSSYEGRVKGTKNILGFNMKVPIFIEESQNIIFFPTNSPRNTNCMWISLNTIDDYEKLKNNYTVIYFACGKKLKLHVSYDIIDNQVLRATRLQVVYDKRVKNYIKNI